MLFLEPIVNVAPTPIADVDAAIERLHAKKDGWLEVGNEARAKLLDACVTSIHASAKRWAEVGASIKGVRAVDDLAGEEWLAGVMPTLRNARLLASAMRQDRKPKPAAVRVRDDGRTVARVFPANLFERLMFSGVTADVVIEKGKPATQGTRRGGEGRVCLVLGGGNVSSIPPMDVFYKLFVEDEVVLLKMNPVNEALGPTLLEALRPLVDEGVLEIVYGGTDVGAHASSHPKVGSLHVTGSDRTYDAIVWGGDTTKTKRANEKPFSAELGCVTPVIVVPGPWSAADIRFQARHVASMVTQNASFNCNAAKVIVTARGWLQREAFLDALHAELVRAKPRKAYYPGARARWKAFLEHYPKAMVLGSVPKDEPEAAVPWTAIPDVSSAAGEYALTHEAFCGVVAEVALDLSSARDGMRRDPTTVDVDRFLDAAVAFANDRCWGTLSCAVLAHTATLESHHASIAKAIDDLRYGAVGLNVWPGVIYGLVSPTWGAYPGHTPEDIQSGVGVVHNAFLFDHPEKSVVRAPFRIRPTPAWFGDHKNLRQLGERLVDFEAEPTWGRFFRVVRAALKG